MRQPMSPNPSNNSGSGRKPVVPRFGMPEAYNTYDIKNFIIRANQNARLYYCKADRPTVIRPYFPLSQGDTESGTPEVCSMFDPNGAITHAEWFVNVPAVQFFGNEKISFAMDPNIDEIPLARQPVTILYRAAKQGVDEKHPRCHEWAYMREDDGKGNYASIRRPESLFVFACLLMELNGEIFNPPKGTAEDDEVCLIGLKSSAFNSMIEEIVMRYPDLHAGNIEYHPFSFEEGFFYSFLQKKYEAGEGGDNTSFSTGFRRENRNNNKVNTDKLQYGCKILEQYRRFLPNAIQPIQEMLLERTRPIASYIDFKNCEDQMDLICNEAGIPASLILYSFADTEFEPMIPASVLKKAAAPEKSHPTGHSGFAQTPNYGHPQGFATPQNPPAPGRTPAARGAAAGFGPPASSPMQQEAEEFFDNHQAPSEELEDDTVQEDVVDTQDFAGDEDFPEEAFDNPEEGDTEVAEEELEEEELQEAAEEEEEEEEAPRPPRRPQVSAPAPQPEPPLTSFAKPAAKPAAAKPAAAKPAAKPAPAPVKPAPAKPAAKPAPAPAKPVSKQKSQEVAKEVQDKINRAKKGQK